MMPKEYDVTGKVIFITGAARRAYTGSGRCRGPEQRARERRIARRHAEGTVRFRLRDPAPSGLRPCRSGAARIRQSQSEGSARRHRGRERRIAA